MQGQPWVVDYVTEVIWSPGGEVIQDGYVVVFSQQQFHQVTANKPGSSGDYDPHFTIRIRAG
jgi:hypothetical protein